MKNIPPPSAQGIKLIIINNNKREREREMEMERWRLSTKK
jgi:hypothetical protein